MCAHCGSPAIHSCARCLRGLDIVGSNCPPTYYCDDLCQAAHKPKHREACNVACERRQLLRAGDLVQALFNAYRHAVFDVPIRRVKTDAERSLHVYVGPVPPGQILLSFPNDDFKGDNGKKALLAWSSRFHGAGHMQNLLRQALKGIDDIEDIFIKPRHNAHQIVYHNGNGEIDADDQNLSHLVHRVTIGGVRYALDLA